MTTRQKVVKVQWISTSQAAMIAKKDGVTLRRMAQRGEIEARVNRTNGRYEFSEQSVRAHVAQMKIGGADAASY